MNVLFIAVMSEVKATVNYYGRFNHFTTIPPLVCIEPVPELYVNLYNIITL